MGLSRKIRVGLSNTFMSLVLVIGLAYHSWIIEQRNKVSIHVPDNINTYINLGLAGYTLMLTGFLIGMLHTVVNKAMLAYGMLVMMLIGWTLILTGAIVYGDFEFDTGHYNASISQLFALSGIFLQGLINVCHMKRELSE